jgi:hypothetical protein
MHSSNSCSLFPLHSTGKTRNVSRRSQSHGSTTVSASPSCVLSPSSFALPCRRLVLAYSPHFVVCHYTRIFFLQYFPRIARKSTDSLSLRRPGSTNQVLHRDDLPQHIRHEEIEEFPKDVRSTGREACLGLFVAGKPATKENGATRVCPPLPLSSSPRGFLPFTPSRPFPFVLPSSTVLPFVFQPTTDSHSPCSSFLALTSGEKTARLRRRMLFTLRFVCLFPSFLLHLCSASSSSCHSSRRATPS